MTSIITDQSGGKYTGDVIKHGKGEYEYPNGDKYVGEFKDDNMAGRGVYTYASGRTYDGDFVDGNRHGRGVLTWADGSKYDGDFVDDKMTGRGVVTGFVFDAGKYDGDVVDGKRTGHGTYTSRSGNTTTGEWKDGRMHGNGSWQGEFAGDKFEGEFKNGLWDGEGRRNFPDGSSYVGNWSNNQMHGQGTITRTNGNTLSGIFNNGEEPVEGIFTEKDGASFKFNRIIELAAPKAHDEVDEEGPWQFEMPEEQALTGVEDATDGIAAKLTNGTIVVVSREWYDDAPEEIPDDHYEDNMVGTLTDVTYPEEGGYIEGTFTPKA